MGNKFIHDIDEAMLTRIIDGDDDFLNDYLEENGYNVDSINDVSVKNFKQLKFMLNAHLNYDSDQSKLELVTKKFSDAIEKNLDRPVAYLNALIKSNQFAVRYRNLDKLSEDEIKNIIRDQNLLEILEMLEKENE